MLVRLNSSTSGTMIMFAEHAHLLFEIVGKEGTASGVFTKEQLPEAIEKLQRAVKEDRQAENPAEDPEEEKPVHAVRLAQRAVPLIHLMEWTLKEKGFILWEAEKDF